jgi:hypothetical protein
VRTVTVPQRALIASARVNHYIWVEVEDPDRVYRDLTNLGGVDWVELVQWGASSDSPTGTATITLRRDTSNPVLQSIAPTMGGSSLNRNGAGAYAPFLDPGRNLRITTAVTAAGVAPTGTDKKVMFVGRIDKVDWHAPSVTVDCRDLGGWVADANIQTEKAYAIDGPEAVEDVMSELLGTYPVFGTPVLVTPTSPGWMIDNTKKTVQARKSVLEALQQDWALSIGWVCRYKFDASDNFQLTFYDPNRSKTVPDDSFGPTEYRDITALEVDDEDVRNLINGIYYDANGNKHTRTAQNLTSQAKYGVKFMEIQLAPGDQIDSDAEMDRLLAAAVSDLGAPFASQEMETLYYWPVELGDLYQFNPNLDHYDSAQNLAVVAYTHKFANGEGVTTIQCRGNVIGAFQAWLRRSAPGGTTADELAIKRITWNESVDGQSREAALTCGDAVDTLHVHHRLWPDAATSGDPFDFSAEQDEAEDERLEIIRPSVTDGLFRFSIPHPPRGYTVTGRLVPRSAPPRFADGESMPFQVLPAPPSIQVAIRPSRSGDTGSVAIDVTLGVSDGPVRLDVILDSLTGSTTLLSVDLAGYAYTLDQSAYPGLGGIALPAGKDYLSVRVIVTDVRKTPWPFGPAHLGRDPLADATVTLLNYRASPVAVIAFGPDTDAIRVTSHDGITTTWNAAELAAAGSPILYLLGTTVRDDSSEETVLIVGETRSGFLVEAEGGGTWATILGPVDLHGEPPVTPSGTAVSFDPISGNTASQAYWGMHVDLPTNALSARWSRTIVAAGANTGIPSYPTVSTVASIGTLASAPSFDVTQQGPVNLGEMVCVTIVPFTGAGGTGTQLPSIQRFATFASFVTAKSVRMGPTEFVFSSGPAIQQQLGYLCPSTTGLLVAYAQLKGVPTGVPIITFAARLFRETGVGTAELQVYKIDASGVGSGPIGGVLLHTTTGWQTVSASVTEVTDGSVYYLFITLEQGTEPHNTSVRVAYAEADYTATDVSRPGAG